MIISYQNYPALLFMDYDFSYDYGKLPFQFPVGEADSKPFKDFLFSIWWENVRDKTKTHLQLSYRMYQKMDGPTPYRKVSMELFYNRSLPCNSGTILTNIEEAPITYIYVTMNPQRTAKYFGYNGEYLGVAMLIENKVIGFEQGIKQDKTISLMKGCFYTDGLESGEMIHFMATALPHILDQDGVCDVEGKENTTNQKVKCLVYDV